MGLSGSDGNGSGKAQTSRPEPGYVMETSTAVQQGKDPLTSLQRKLNNRGKPIFFQVYKEDIINHLGHKKQGKRCF